MNLHQAATLTGATLIGKTSLFRGITTDSREDCTGKLFIALKGENFNGEDYCKMSVDNGAIAVLVSHAQEVTVPQLICPDTMSALTVLGKSWANQCQAKIVAITGSNGKTTVKNMVHAILSVAHNCTATQGNFNNDIGVPLTLCQIRNDDEFAVIEMGAAKLGDIASLVDLLTIHVAAITNVSAAHLGRFGSFANIIQEKGKIISNLTPSDFAILPIDDSNYSDWTGQTQAKILSFGNNISATININQSQPFNLQVAEQTLENIQLPVAGVHNQTNAACATAIAIALNISATDIKTGLESFQPAKGRLENIGKIDGNIIINDSYNANPQSVMAAIDVLATYPTATTLVLGDMAELGEDSITLHQQVGEYAKQHNISHLLTIGEYALHASRVFSPCIRHFNDMTAIQQALIKDWHNFGTILFKGSRSMHLEDLIHAIQLEKAA